MKLGLALHATCHPSGSHALRQLSSPGKSGCLFFLSDDQRLLVKSMRKSEIHVLMDMLPKVRECEAC
jgi:hypothetical protein